MFCLTHSDLGLRNKQCVTRVIHVTQHVGHTKTKCEAHAPKLIRVYQIYSGKLLLQAKLGRDPGKRYLGTYN